MKVAVIGGGFAGLGVAHFLLELNATVTIFDQGGSASSVASGLMHPYPGLSARRSTHATEAMAVSKELIKIAEANTPRMVASEVGILRQSASKEQEARLLSHANEFQDVEPLGDGLFLIHSGVTIFSNNYLEGLTLALQKKGALFIQKTVHSLSELEEFDHIVVAAGYGVAKFPECKHLKVQFLKGQALTMEGEAPHQKSFISRGYIARGPKVDRFEIGSTYEKQFSSVEPDLERAKALLEDKLRLCPGAKILDCRSAVRVCSQGHYTPIIEKISEKISVFTGLGSRGLLYHGFYGRMLAARIVQKD
jgi:glycine/D-amino acid oxidase-like deaminating enzyme